ncbi:MAG: radical SAM protein [Firmicutes bacterium]|nr:radical SAM protein [Bacillota bacterium]
MITAEIKNIVDKAVGFCTEDTGDCSGATGPVLSRDEIIALLSVDEKSEDADYIRSKAHEAALKVSGGKARLWGAMGIDFVPCSCNCDFCSFGEKWGIVKESKIYSMDEIKAQMREYVEAGVYYIVMRTTEFYSIDDLCEQVRDLRASIEGNYEIILNIGEFEYVDACRRYEAGVSGIYHACRIHEGIDTGISPERRKQTMKAVQASPLKLISLVEPVGIEHTAEELADNFLNIIDHGAYMTGVMSRTPVPGTPLGDKYEMISAARNGLIAAVTRLACGPWVKHICAHPASLTAINSGANIAVVETGAIPRDDKLIEDEWLHFTEDKAMKLFRDAGFAIGE